PEGARSMCSYCGCSSIAVIGRFMAEHEALINATTDLRAGCHTGDQRRVEAAADRLATILHPHTHAEEVGVFALLREDPDFTEHVDRLCAEHVDLDARLAELRSGAHDRYAGFEQALRTHIDREENGLFPAAAIAFAGPEWEQVAALTPPA
ncbi:MAG: hemerythrin domain-containing protein, partial [Nostocoides sp.]